IRAKKIGKRTRGIDAFVPTGEGRAFRAFHDRGADDGDGQVAAPAREDGFAETFRERVSIGPAEMLRATQADTHATVARPARSLASQNTANRRSRRGRL